MRIDHGKWAADDDTVRAIPLDELRKAKGDTASNVKISIATANRGGLAMIVSTNGSAGSDIFPFGGFVVVDVEDVARFY